MCWFMQRFFFHFQKFQLYKVSYWKNQEILSEGRHFINNSLIGKYRNKVIFFTVNWGYFFRLKDALNVNLN